MTLILIKNHKTLNMTSLMRSVLRYIYEPESMKPEDVRLMQESMVNWKNHLDLKIDMALPFKINDLDQEYLELLQDCAKLLTMNEQGELDDRKRLFKEHNVDWKKFHRLPEAYKPEDFVKAQESLEKTKKANPEDYQ